MVVYSDPTDYVGSEHKFPGRCLRRGTPNSFSPRRTDAAAPAFLFAIQATTGFFLSAKQLIEKRVVFRISFGFRAGKIRLISARRRWCWREFPARSVRTKPARMRAPRFTVATCFTNGKARMPKVVSRS